MSDLVKIGNKSALLMEYKTKQIMYIKKAICFS